MDKKQIVIVCGYGCHLTPGYQEYLRRVVRYIGENFVELIIVCGGKSQQKTAPDKSEAEVISSFLQNEPDWEELYAGRCGLPKIICETCSLTTLKNLGNAKDFIGEFSPKEYRLIIFCDASRALKVKLLAMSIFPEYDIQIETYDLSSRGEVKKQLMATNFEVLALKFPFLSRWHHQQRVKRAGRI